MIETHFLQIIEQAFFRIPKSMHGVCGEFRQRQVPVLGFLFWKLNRPPQAFGQELKVGAGFLCGRISLVG